MTNGYTKTHVHDKRGHNTRPSELVSGSISKDAGVSRVMVTTFLSGRRDISTTTADKLASVLGLKLKVG